VGISQKHSQKWVLTLALSPFAVLLTACGSGFGSSLFSASTYCTGAVTTNCISQGTSNASVYFSMDANVITKQHLYGSTVPLPGQSLQISGTCNQGSALANMVTYTVTDSSNAVVGSGADFGKDIYGVTYVADNPSTTANPTFLLSNPGQCKNPPSLAGGNLSATNCMRVGFCENGRFTLTLTAPYDGVNTLASCTTCTTVAGQSTPPVTQKPFQVTVTLWTGPTMSALVKGPYFTNTFYVQY